MAVAVHQKKYSVIQLVVFITRAIRSSCQQINSLHDIHQYAEKTL